MERKPSLKHLMRHSRNPQTPENPPEPPTELWVWCWPETKTHEIVTGQTMVESAKKLRGDHRTALGTRYRGGPCPVCRSFEITPQALFTQPRKEPNIAKIIQFPGHRDQNHADQSHP